jgi:hypothetical protein
MGQYGLLFIFAAASAQLALGIEVASDTGFEVASETVSVIKPEAGDNVPPYVRTFPGCSCKWNEASWECEGTKAHPPEYQGQSCCCCGLKCEKSNRCSNEACLAINYDQKAEIEAEEKRIAELLKGADFLIGEDLPAFVVDLGQGSCTVSKIVQKCKEKGLTPVCDHTSYARENRCYTPGWRNTGWQKNFYNKHFSHWSSHRQYMKLPNDEQFYGMCFYGINGGWALSPYSSSHAWTNSGHVRLTPWNGGDKKAPHHINPTFAQVNTCLAKDKGGVGCWRTLCVKKEPNKLGDPR